MGRTKSGGQKHELDKLYTRDEDSLNIVKRLDLNKFDAIIEPSAGDGSFLRALESTDFKGEIFAYDIAPDSSKILQQDFLKLSEPFEKFKNILILGNPPYGQQNTLAIAFVNHAASFESVKQIAFILPPSFQKDSIKNKINRNFSLTLNERLENSSYLLNGESIKVSTIFQIWERTSEKREIAPRRTKTDLFTVVKNREKADFRIQRVGGSAGRASMNLDASMSSNYFLKLNEENYSGSVLEFVNFVNTCNFPTADFTVGPKSISLSELIEVIENELNFKSDNSEERNLFDLFDSSENI